MTQYDLTHSDITPAFIEQFYESCIDGWYDGPIDWEQAIDRSEFYTGLCYGTSWDSPAILKLKRAIRRMRSA